MPRPWTIPEILKLREDKLASIRKSMEEQASKAQGSLSDPLNQTVSINQQPLPEILTIVSWNVQTFEAGKSLKNPFVNAVINAVLEALSVDVCILLETRANSYINMNAIETGDRNSGKWVQSGKEDEDGDEEDQDEDEEQDVAEDDENPDETLPDDEEDDDDPEVDNGDADDWEELNGGEPLRYLQVVSEMTGKRWMPPYRVYVYHPAVVAQTKLIKEVERYKSLIKKVSAQTGREPSDVEGLLQKVAPMKPQKAALKAFKEEVDKVTVKPVKGKKPKKIAVKDTKALFRMTKGLMANPKRYDDVQNVSPAMATFAHDYQFNPKWLKSMTVDGNSPSDKWKAVLLSDEAGPLRTYYDLYVLDPNYVETLAKSWGDVKALTAGDNWRFCLRLKRCPNCKIPLGKGECAVCEGLGPLTTSLSNLRQTIDAITFHRGAAQESYSVLVRPSTMVTAPSEQGIWLNGKRVQVVTVASKLLMREPDVKEIVKGQKKPVLKAGKLLGYQDGSSKFYGRCPFCVPLHIWPPASNQEASMQLIGFHGPYGASTNAGVEARSASMTELMKAGVGAENTPLKDAANAMIIGDFNLDWAPQEKKPDTKQEIAKALYEGFKKLDFLPMIEGGIATSLISTHGEKQTWKTLPPEILSYTSSAYDNLFVKGEGIRKFVAHSAVIDVISWIEQHLDEFQIDPADSPPPDFASLAPKAQAFFIYHNYVSDHLPVMCDMWVQAMPENSPSAQKALQLRVALNEEARRSKAVERYEVVMKYEAILDIELAGGEPDYYSKRDDDSSRYARVVGTVHSHQEGALLVACLPSPKDRIWISYRPEMKGKPVKGKMLETFLRAFPPGARVIVDVLNPSFLP